MGDLMKKDEIDAGCRNMTIEMSKIRTGETYLYKPKVTALHNRMLKRY